MSRSCLTPTVVTKTYPVQDPSSGSGVCELLPDWEPCTGCDKSGYDKGDPVKICINGVAFVAVSLADGNTDSPLTGSTATPPTWELQRFGDALLNSAPETLTKCGGGKVTGSVIQCNQLNATQFKVVGGEVSLVPEDSIEAILGVKDFYVVGLTGQSNAIGQCPGGDMTANPDVFAWHINNGAFQVADFNGAYPMTIGTGSVAGQGDNNAGWAFAKRINEETGKPVYLVLNAKGGEAIVGWDTGGYTDTFKSTVDDALAAIGADKLDVLLWLQGERDLKLGTSWESYANSWESMLDNLDQASWFDKATTPIITSPINKEYIDNPDNDVSASTMGAQEFLAGLGGYTPEFGLTNTASPMNLTTCDGTHLTGSSLHTLGYHRMYDALLSVNDSAGEYTPMPAGGASSSGDDRHLEFYVDQSGGDDTATGLTPGAALATMQEAINRAPRNSSLTIHLASDYATVDNSDVIYLKQNVDIAVNMRQNEVTLAGSTTETANTNTVIGFRWVSGCRENGLTLSGGTLNLPDGDPSLPRGRSAAAVLGGPSATPHRVALRVNNVLVNQSTTAPIAALLGSTSQNEHPILELSTNGLSANTPLAGWYVSGVAAGTDAATVSYLTTSRTTL